MCHTCYKTVTKWNLRKSHRRNADAIPYPDTGPTRTTTSYRNNANVIPYPDTGPTRTTTSYRRNAVSSSTGLQQEKQHTTLKANPNGFRIKCGMTLPHFIAKPEAQGHSVRFNRHTAEMRYPVARNIARTHKDDSKEKDTPLTQKPTIKKQEKSKELHQTKAFQCFTTHSPRRYRKGLAI